MRVSNIVVDTSIFVNPDARTFFGTTSNQAFAAFLDLLAQKKDVACFMPPSVHEELMKFIDKKPPAKKALLIKKIPPSSYQGTIPALFLYEFIEEARNRINKGLRIAEKYARKGIAKTPSNDQSSDQDLIKTLRNEFRIALREGILDSKEDFDLILLAKELEASLSTSDQGLITWAAKLGIPCLSPEELHALVTG